MSRLKTELNIVVFFMIIISGIFDFPDSVSLAEENFRWERVETTSIWSPRSGHAAVVFDDKIWVLGGTLRNDVWYSSDGVEWIEAVTEADWFPRSGLTSVVFDDRMWVIGGENWIDFDDVWFTSDGLIWTRAGSMPVNQLLGITSLVFEVQMWIVGGEDPILAKPSLNVQGSFPDYVWYSTDGAEWMETTGNVLWAPRSAHASVVFDDKIWVISGVTGVYGEAMPDVWFSPDGVQWFQATPDGGPKVAQTAAAVFANQMWVMGGRSSTYESGSTFSQEVWTSTDGANWESNTYPTMWSPRADHAAVVFRNKLWVLGGEGSEGLLNDVWVLRDPSGLEAEGWSEYR